MVGGVSDHSAIVARLLAPYGNDVHVWCSDGAQPLPPAEKGITVHPVFHRFSMRELSRVSESLAASRKRRALFLQWVPHAFGHQSLNIFLCLWLLKRRMRFGDDVTVMFHEAFLEFDLRRWRQAAAALVHRIMATLLLRASNRVWVSIPRWEARLERYAPADRVFSWVPIPSSFAVVNDQSGVERLRGRIASGPGIRIVGHFGIAGDQRVPVVQKAFCSLLRARDDVHVLFIGQNSEKARQDMLTGAEIQSDRIHCTGTISPAEVSRAIQICDVLLQPYPDGVSSRRGSLMAALDHGIAVATNAGIHTEPVWREAQDFTLAASDSAPDLVDLALRLLESPELQRVQAQAGRNLYRAKFGIERVRAAVAALSIALGCGPVEDA